ncbi:MULTISPECIES: multiprotein bridging factor aMBF1 [Haloferax]|uniref:TIGR00270 family protein n=2 Tax=Haloferax TaxID=2251 RepID=A0A6G1Z479_9EURY|nr:MULTISPECIES: multiprotein bridging factor aMBF1 [Haloferax]KAB1188639.1 TIGR00270 family protein [Haloferax sp. CBA1149]MRW81342.1 TIGR00270 family protein [Haloferax marinisediminis]
MPQCEMCGSNQASLKTVKVEGAELQLCDNCAQFGTEVRTESTSSASSKYSTSSSSGKAKRSSGSSSSSSSKTRRRRDMFDDMDEIATDYDSRIRQARESRGMSQEELASSLNEKASLIRKLERGDIMPPDTVRKKIERKLDISLVEGESDDDSEWSGGGSTTTTLGDVVKRKD